MIKYELRTKVPNLNDYISALSKNRYAGGKLKKQMQEEIMWLIKSQGLKKVKGKVDVYLTFIEKDKKRDKDNVIASGCKLIMDSLVNLEVIKDDSWQYINQYIPRVILGNEYKVIIELIEI